MEIDKIQKRDGRIVPFNQEKIASAINKAFQAVNVDNPELVSDLAKSVVDYLKAKQENDVPSVEEIQDVVEHVLIESGNPKAAKEYILYRSKRTRLREAKSELMDIVQDILIEPSKENANIGNSPSAKMLQIASAASRQFYLSRMIREDIAQAHINGDIHIHDLDFLGKTLTCVQIPLGKLLSTGFNNGHGFIRPPKRIGSASALACIILQSSQNDMHGGQSFAFFDTDMAPFVGNASDEEVFQAMEAFVYNLNSMHSRAGAQVPFSSVNLGCDMTQAGRAVTKGLLLAYEAGLGKGETPIFPNIIFRLKKGVNMDPGDPNYDLFRLAMRVSAKRLNPTFAFMDSSFNAPYGEEASYMGCRTRALANRHGAEVSTGRGNLSFTTVNLPRLAIRANGDIDKFFALLDETMELVGQQLYDRYLIQSKLHVCDMPFLMGQHLYLDSEKLKMDDEIGPVIKHGTLSIGLIGLAETLILLTGKHHGESQASQEQGLKIIEFMRKKTDQLSDIYDLNYSLLATPAEGLSGRFVKMDAKRYGIIPGVTDKDYYTNSSHIPVSYKISSFDKVRIEGAYHKFENAGHISYVELASPPIHNLDAYEQLIRQMAKSDIGYAGINFPIDECAECGYHGIFPAECPSCGSEHNMRIRRITGYLSYTDRFNNGKLAELKDRVPHN